MQSFADWLSYYNDLDVAPRLEALYKMRAFYTDILIDVVGELGLSLERFDRAKG